MPSCSRRAWPCRGPCEAADLLINDWGVAADVWSVTSWSQLRRDGLAADEWNLLHPEEPHVPYLSRLFDGVPGPRVAVSDYMRAVPDQIAPWLPGGLVSLGTDGFGFSDTRAAARRFFHVDGPSVTVRTLAELVRAGELKAEVTREAIDRYRLWDVTAGATGAESGQA